MDQRDEKLANILVHYSIKAKKGDKVIIDFHEAGKTLALEVYKKLLDIGAFVYLEAKLDGFEHAYYKHASSEQINHVFDFEHEKPDEVDARVVIRSSFNSKEMSNIAPEKIAARRKTMQPFLNKYVEKRWILTYYPSHGMAQEADMSLEEYKEFYFKTCLLDWESVKESQEKLKNAIDDGKVMRVVGEKTDITLSMEGRDGIKCCGEHNMPDGEVFYAPVETQVNGHVYFDLPSIFSGKEVKGIYLEFENGKIIKATAEKNQELLHAILSTDEGSKYLGEVGIGTNFQITKPTKEILFDEKIGGSIHMAVGRAYKEGGGQNESAIHWDMIKDLRKKGEIYIDGKLIQKNGKFLLD